MKIKSKLTGQTIDISEEGAKRLIAAKIYDAVEEPKKETPKEPKKSDKPTKVEPMTTEDMPAPPKKVA